MRDNVKIHFDGACDNNKRKPYMGIGVAVFVNGKLDKRFCVARNTGVGTSNLAEWWGCFLAFKVMKTMRELGYENAVFTIYSDSQLITNQYNGSYVINKHEFLNFYRRAKYLAQLCRFTGRIVWIRREYNTEADRLSKEGLQNPVNFEMD